MKTTFFHDYKKAQTTQQTHFCPGCGHGNILKFADEAIIDLDIATRTIWVSPVGCGGLTDAYMAISHILSAHGRASAVATAVKRLKPNAVVIVSQGDGDLSSIGLLEAIHAANRGENLTVLFINNANFAMTGGQLAPTSWNGQITATTPNGRSPQEHGLPLKLCELLAQTDGPAFIARVAIGNSAQLRTTQKTIRRAIQNQLENRGYSFVEILSPCPSNWHCTPAEARKIVAENMIKTFPLGIFRDESRKSWIENRLQPIPYAPEIVETAFQTLTCPTSPIPSFSLDLQWAKNEACAICCSGFGGQGIMTIGRALAQLALMADLHATWMPSYGPEMRGGAANCFVRIAKKDIAAPIIDSPDVLLAMNQPSLEKFAPKMKPNSKIFYNNQQINDISCVPNGVELFSIPASQIADEIGDSKSANFVLLGALLHRLFKIDWHQLENREHHPLKKYWCAVRAFDEKNK